MSLFTSLSSFKSFSSLPKIFTLGQLYMSCLRCSKKPSDQFLSRCIHKSDPDISDLIQEEQLRQWRGLELIASENFVSNAVLEALGTCFTNKYAEGMPYKRYYGGNEVVDKLETLCQKRALEAFHLNEKEWGVNVQPYSGSPANFEAYTGMLEPGDRIMGLDLPSGGHLTHGFYTAKKKISSTSMYFNSLPYRLNEETGYIDYEKLEDDAKRFVPKMIICGGSAYPREWDYKRFRKIADSVGAYLLCDMAHISGLVASGQVESPFKYCDIVTTTTHKTLRGPRAGMIFFKLEYKDCIDNAVFPGCQGGPHENTIAGLAVALKETMTPEFIEYQKQLKKNAAAMANSLVKKGYKLITGGTDNHLLLWNLRPNGVTGSKLEVLCDLCHITINKNSIIGDTSPMNPGGVRLGTPALTSRGLKEYDMEIIVDFLHRAVLLCQEIQKKSGSKLNDFKKAIVGHPEVEKLSKDVQMFACKFYMPAFDDEIRNTENAKKIMKLL